MGPADVTASDTKMFLDKKAKIPAPRSEEKSTMLTEHILEIPVIGEVMINPSKHGADINRFGKVVNHSIDTAALVADARFCEQTAADNILEMETALIVPGITTPHREDYKANLAGLGETVLMLHGSEAGINTPHRFGEQTAINHREDYKVNLAGTDMVLENIIEMETALIVPGITTPHRIGEQTAIDCRED